MQYFRRIPLFWCQLIAFAPICFAVLTAPLMAQEFPAPVKAVADKYTADLDTLDKQKVAAEANAKQAYVAALSAAENSALSGGQFTLVAAVNKERNALNAEGLVGAPPPEFPKALSTARKTYTDALLRIASEVSATKDRVDIAYLKNLNGLLATATPEVAKAVSDEKTRILTQPRMAPPPRAVPSQPTSKPPVTNFIGFGKPLNELTEVVPYDTYVFGNVKLKRVDKSVPDELSVSVKNSQIVFSGAKKSDTARVNGDLIAHYGKLALINSSGPQSGTLVAKVRSVPDGTHYGIAIEVPAGKLIHDGDKRVNLEADVVYQWETRIENDRYIFEITKPDKTSVTKLTAKAEDVRAFGFLCTVRYRGNKSDLTITVNPSKTIK